MLDKENTSFGFGLHLKIAQNKEGNSELTTLLD